MKKYVIITAISCSVFSCAMETPLEKANAEQMRYQQADACAEIMRDKIDQNILGIDTNKYLRSVAGRYYSRNRNASLTTQQDIVNEIDQIASYMPSTDQPDLVLSCLHGKHSLFGVLIDRLVDHEVDNLISVRGSTIDHILLDEKRKICISDAIDKYVKEKALKKYSWNKQGKDYRPSSLPEMNFIGEKDIHFAPLFGHCHVYIGDDRLLMSSDSKYLRAIDDIQQKTIIWDMQTGEPMHANEVENISNSYSWTRSDEYDPYHRYKGERVIDKNGKYLATPVAFASGGSSIRAIGNKIYSSYSFPVIMLFVKPTAESQLCQDAFLQSKDDEEELKALQISQAVNKLEGLPARNLKSLIVEALKNVHNQARL
jgi:hypothetical protein